MSNCGTKQENNSPNSSMRNDKSSDEQERMKMKDPMEGEKHNDGDVTEETNREETRKEDHVNRSYNPDERNLENLIQEMMEESDLDDEEPRGTGNYSHFKQSIQAMIHCTFFI